MARDEGKESTGRTLAANILLLIIGLSVAYGLFVGLEMGYSTDSPLRVVISPSMVPELNVGDVVVVKGVGPQYVPVLFLNIPVQGESVSNIKVGDDIIFWYPVYSTTDPIVHKVIQINPNSNSCGGDIQFVTHGVNNPQGADEFPCASAVIGVVTGKIPYVGYVSEFLRSPVGIVLIIALIGILLAIEILEPEKDESNSQ